MLEKFAQCISSHDLAVVFVELMKFMVPGSIHDDHCAVRDEHLKWLFDRYSRSTLDFMNIEVSSSMMDKSETILKKSLEKATKKRKAGGVTSAKAANKKQKGNHGTVVPLPDISADNFCLSVIDATGAVPNSEMRDIRNPFLFFACSTHNPQTDVDHHNTKGLRADVDFTHEFS